MVIDTRNEPGRTDLADGRFVADRDRRGQQDPGEQRVRFRTDVEESSHHGDTASAVLVHEVGLDIGREAVDPVLRRRVEVTLHQPVRVVSDAQRGQDALRDR
jgi:hypothetical protein